MIGKTKRQHYVPQHYLRGFSNLNKKEYYLYVYNKENIKVYPSNIRKICYENYFYDFNKFQLIENKLSLLEYKFSKILRNIIANNDLNDLSIDDKEVLSKFIAIQELRTPEFRIITEEIYREYLCDLLKKNMPNINTENMKFFKPFLRNTHVDSMFSTFYTEIYNDILNEMSWKLCINNTDKPFWTSDNPCARYNKLEFENNDIKLKWEDSQLHFPLSDKLLLIFENTKKVNGNSKEKNSMMPNLTYKLQYFNEEQVKIENYLQTRNSTQYIFSNNNNFKHADDYLDKYPRYRDKYRERKDD